MDVLLTKTEKAYLEATGFINSSVHKITPVGEDNYCLEVDDEVADDIRNLCADRLQIVGFDRFGQPTPEGLLWEAMIDKFFTG